MREDSRHNPDTIDYTGTIAPASTTTVYSEEIDLNQKWNRSVWVELAGAGTVDVRVFYVVAYWDEATNTFSDFVEQEEGSDLINNVEDTNLHNVSLHPNVSDRIKIGFEGQGSNGADVTVADLRISFGGVE